MAQDTTNETVAGAVAIMSLSTFVLCLRLISKFLIVRKSSLDDCLLYIGWVLAIGLSVTLCCSTKVGMGKHASEISPSNWIPLRKCMYAMTVLYSPSIMFIQTSILVFYLRIASNVQKAFRIATKITLLIVLIGGIVFTFLAVFQCSPINAIWSSHENLKCIPTSTLSLLSSTMYLITDVAIILLPLPILTAMNMPTKQKLILILTFMTGVFVVIVNVVRVYWLQQLATHGAGSLAALDSEAQVKEDSSLYASYAFAWSSIQLHTATICACVPSIKPLIAKIMPRIIFSPSDQAERQAPTSTKDKRLTSGPTNRNNHLSSFNSTSSLNISKEEAAVGSQVSASSSFKEVRKKRATAKATSGWFHAAQPGNLLEVSNRQSLLYCSVSSILYCLFGFSYGIIGALNSTTSAAAHLNATQSVSLTVAYFGGLPLGGIFLGYPVVKRYGFRMAFSCGLILFAIGVIIFWPCAVLLSLPGFIISNVVIGAGLGTIECAITPFFFLCGPAKFGTIRLCLGLSVWSAGRIIGKAIGTAAIYAPNLRPEIQDIQWTYLALFFIAVILAVIIYYVPFPEVSDSQLEQQKDENIQNFNTPTLLRNGHPIYVYTWVLGLFCLFTQYSARQHESTLAGHLLKQIRAEGRGSVHLSDMAFNILVPLFSVLSRLMTAGLCFFVPPETLLFIYFVLLLIFTACMSWIQTTATGVLSFNFLYYFFAAPLVPLTDALILAGMGRQTKLAGLTITCMQLASSLFNWPVSFMLQGSYNAISGTYPGFIFLAASFVFPLFITLSPTTRKRYKLLLRPEKITTHQLPSVDNVS